MQEYIECNGKTRFVIPPPLVHMGINLKNFIHLGAIGLEGLLKSFLGSYNGWFVITLHIGYMVVHKYIKTKGLNLNIQFIFLHSYTLLKACQ